VLSVAAAKLGFDPVHALDDDPFAVRTTIANATANSVQVEARRADVTTHELPDTDAVVANIALLAVETLASRVRATTLVTSGYLRSDTPRVDAWTHVERRMLDEWAADRYERSG
jgi:ribosomal protein L11 methylase PrmA